ncbi:MAG TPA: tRNA (adenosine(37)-N6)-threonylcarbamoyltransferase complex dimerization subunit type 1 TsaB, partial [Candidatus Aminicenantes bacterium]|nr:tRNA (adenosine(37)-N6)-threonylcarbamoyltransferase complex dimerization subunit type 1 TsaB [Candidatus Aminicenantes bacterium]
MRILAVDTTTWTGSVALLEDAKLVCEVNWESRSSHASRLLSSVDHVLEAGGIQIRDVDGFAVAVGPGSFTGIRIGLSTVKALAFASRKPVAAVSTLRALALKLAGPRTDLLCPAL